MLKDCKYADSDNMVRDRIVIGIRSHTIHEKLINVGSDLTLEKATEIASLHELSSVQAKTMSGEDVAVNEIRTKNRGSTILVRLSATQNTLVLNASVVKRAIQLARVNVAEMATRTRKLPSVRR